MQWNVKDNCLKIGVKRKSMIILQYTCSILVLAVAHSCILLIVVASYTPRPMTLCFPFLIDDVI